MKSIKKLSAIALALFVSVVAIDAQNAPSTATVSATVATKTKPVKKEHIKKVATQTATVPSATTPLVSKAKTDGGKATAEAQTIGKDAKGRILYKGSRGGVYYLTEKGNKEYVKQ